MQNQYQVFVSTGETVSFLSSEKPGLSLVLIAPARIESGDARGILRKAKSAALLLPSFDDDGRVSFWEEATAAESDIKGLQLEGVGS